MSKTYKFEKFTYAPDRRVHYGQGSSLIFVKIHFRGQASLLFLSCYHKEDKPDGEDSAARVFVGGRIKYAIIASADILSAIIEKSNIQESRTWKKYASEWCIAQIS